MRHLVYLQRPLSAVFLLFYLLLGHFYAKFLLTGGDFGAKWCFFAKLRALFHSNQLVAPFISWWSDVLGIFLLTKSFLSGLGFFLSTAVELFGDVSSTKS